MRALKRMAVMSTENSFVSLWELSELTVHTKSQDLAFPALCADVLRKGAAGKLRVYGHKPDGNTMELIPITGFINAGIDPLWKTDPPEAALFMRDAILSKTGPYTWVALRLEL